ncbi:hypothetical protein C8J57DRAFT_1297412 [Mycena rebaudengoi]|nr:hypothetical protein C8J57DRAFT_1297412 [Mycena rebaudengoi]
MSPTRVASYPFNDESADIILRSSDDVDFHVHKLILSLVSPVFKDMFSLPQGPDSNSGETVGGLPVIRVAESQKVLHQILTWCDPRCNPTSALDADEMGILLAATDKYDMAPVTTRIAGAFQNNLSKLVEAEALRVFAIAYRYKNYTGMPELIKKAARETLKMKTPFARVPMKDFNHIPGDVVQRLYVYHAACSNMAPDLTKQWDWLKADGELPWLNCPLCPSQKWIYGGQKRNVSKWWIEYMQFAGRELEILRKSEGCPQLATLYPTLAQFLAQFAAQVGGNWTRYVHTCSARIRSRLRII